ncbi:MAG: phospho-N-acetylmuramoyl-pentapeptide-transferase [Bacteroidaceae bacterium]|nr:phospho-N-acetylmuramoyl-pentapeptide-transferase [Bacteroidaceae bacterium]
MLYHLFESLSATHHIPGSGMFTYVSFRAIFALVASIVISVWFGSHFIDYLKKKKISETQRDAKTDPFGVGKVGVPTMGGVIIILAILVPCLLVGDLTNVYMLLMIFTTLLLGGLGFADDYIKTFRKNKEGLPGIAKICGQVLLGLVVGLTMRYSPQVVINEKVETRIENNVEVVVKTPDVKSTRTTIPFLKNNDLNYADMFGFLGEKAKYQAGWIFFVLLTIFVVTAVSNGSNMNDGMDGMAAGNSAIIGIALGLLAYVSSNVVTAGHYNLMYIPGSQEIVIFLFAFIGSLIGFLWYNSYPAQIFMGDTGSLAIGGIIAVSALCIHKELLLPMLCGVFVMESISVIGQRLYYKTGKKKGVHRRIWKRAPFHDHFRTSLEQVQKTDPGSTVLLKGHGNLQFETKITLRFWIVSIGLAALTILTLKIR